MLYAKKKLKLQEIFHNCRIAGNWAKMQEIPAIAGDIGTLF
jgi:hypothetical protein